MAEAGFVVCVVANEPQMRQARVRIDPARSAADNAAAAWRRVYKTDPPHSIQLAYTDGEICDLNAEEDLAVMRTLAEAALKATGRCLLVRIREAGEAWESMAFDSTLAEAGGISPGADRERSSVSLASANLASQDSHKQIRRPSQTQLPLPTSTATATVGSQVSRSDPLPQPPPYPGKPSAAAMPPNQPLPPVPSQTTTEAEAQNTQVRLSHSAPALVASPTQQPAKLHSDTQRPPPLSPVTETVFPADAAVPQTILGLAPSSSAYVRGETVPPSKSNMSEATTPMTDTTTLTLDPLLSKDAVVDPSKRLAVIAAEPSTSGSGTTSPVMSADDTLAINGDLREAVDEAEVASSDDSDAHRQSECFWWWKANHPVSRLFEMLTMAVIILSIFGFILASLPQYRLDENREEREGDNPTFFAIESFCIAWFTIEYLMRIYGAEGNRFRWALRPLNLIDLVAILPYYITLGLGRSGASSLAVIRVLRLTRVSRLLKVFRRMQGLQDMALCLSRARNELMLFITIILTASVLFGSAIFYAEKDENPDLISIAQGMWWSVITTTTVGYGDISPVTPQGKFIGMVCASLGVIFIAIPAGIVISEFMRIHDERQREKKQIFEHDQAFDRIMDLISETQDALEDYKFSRERYEKKLKEHYKKEAMRLKKEADSASSSGSRRGLKSIVSGNSLFKIQEMDASEFKIRKGNSETNSRGTRSTARAPVSADGSGGSLPDRNRGAQSTPNSPLSISDQPQADNRRVSPVRLTAAALESTGSQDRLASHGRRSGGSGGHVFGGFGGR